MNRTIRCAVAMTTVIFAGVAAMAADDSAPAKTKGPEPLVISMGQEVKLEDYLVPGKTTIFDFYSKYCPPCMAMAPRVKKLHETRDDIAVVEVNINRPGIEGIDWHSPVAAEFQLDSIPHFKIFGADGKLVAQGEDAYTQIIGMVK